MAKPEIKKGVSLEETDLDSVVKNLEKVDCTDVWLRKIRTMFNIFDFKRTGAISKDSFKEFAYRFKEHADLSEEQTTDMFNVMASWWRMVVKDADCMTWEQYYKTRYVILDNPLLAKEDQGITDEFINTMFEVMDLNRDGVISPQEWRILFLSIGCSDQTLADESFQAIDCNNDGVISLPEYFKAVHDFMENPNESKYISMFGPLAEV